MKILKDDYHSSVINYWLVREIEMDAGVQILERDFPDKAEFPTFRKESFLHLPDGKMLDLDLRKGPKHMLMSAIKLSSWSRHEIWETVAAEKVKKKSRLLWVMMKSHLFLAAAATVPLMQP